MFSSIHGLRLFPRENCAAVFFVQVHVTGLQVLSSPISHRPATSLSFIFFLINSNWSCVKYGAAFGCKPTAIFKIRGIRRNDGKHVRVTIHDYSSRYIHWHLWRRLNRFSPKPSIDNCSEPVHRILALSRWKWLSQDLWISRFLLIISVASNDFGMSEIFGFPNCTIFLCWRLCWFMLIIKRDCSRFCCGT